MATQKGAMISYSATLPIKRTVTDRILMADPMTIVAINALGLSSDSKFTFVNTPGKQYEWLEDTYNVLTNTLNTAALTSDSTLTQFTVTSGEVFQAGDVLQLDDEFVTVTSVSSDIITATRAVAGTQATHASAITVYIRSRARFENATAGDSAWVEPTTGYNFSQILQKTIEVSRSNQLLNRYGIPDLTNREINKAMDELMMLLNRIPYYGYRAAGSGTTTSRAAGGLDVFITTNPSAASSAALTLKLIEDEIQQCWDAGGQPDLILCGGWAKRKIADMFNPYVRTERDEDRGGITIDYIDSALGGISLAVAVDRHCPTDNVYIIDSRYASYVTIDPFFEEELGKTKDSAFFGQVVGEYGFAVGYEKAHSIITGISTSA